MENSREKLRAARLTLALALAACALALCIATPQHAWAEEATANDGVTIVYSDSTLGVAVDSQGLVYFYSADDYTGEAYWEWIGYYKDNAWALGSLNEDQLKQLEGKVTQITKESEVTVLGVVDGLPVGGVGFWADPNEFSAVCTKLDLSATSIKEIEGSPGLNSLAHLREVVFPPSLETIQTEVIDKLALTRVEFTNPDGVNLFGSGDDPVVTLQEGGSLVVPDGCANVYLGCLLGRDNTNGGPGRSTSRCPVKIIGSDGASREPRTKQEVFGAAGKSNPIAVDGATGLAFAINPDGTAACIGFNNLTKEDYGDVEVVIPSVVDGKYAVTSIARQAFLGKPKGDAPRPVSVKSIKIPDTVKTIESFAFDATTIGEPLVVPASVTAIEYRAFSSPRVSKITVLGDLSIPAQAFSAGDREDSAGNLLPTIGAIELPNITSYEAGAISPSRGLKSLAVNPEATLVPGGGTSILSSNEGGPSLVYVSGSADLVKQYEQTVKDNIGKSNEANKDNPDYKPLFMVTFLDEKGGTQVTEQVAKGEKLGDDQQPQDVKEQPGFEFAGWLDESDPENWWAFDKTFDKDVKYTARWIDLAPVREAAAKAVDEALASYKESDYTAEGWAALTKAAADAKAAVNAAGSTADVEAAKAAGIKDMADIAANPANRPAKPVDPDKPTDPDKPVDPSGPTGPDTPSGPTDPAGPSDPVDPSEPSDPSNPAGPGEPSGPADPAQPASSGEPTSGAPAASDDAAKKPVALAKTGDVLPLAAGALALAALASTAFAFVARKRSAR